MLELTNIEKLAIAQALLNSIGDMTKTKCETNLRGLVDAEIKERYLNDSMAAKSYDVKVQGQKVGTMSLTISKPKPAVIEHTLNVKDSEQLLEWAIDNGFVDVNMPAVIEYFRLNGDIPAGCYVEETIKPEVLGGEITKTTLKVDSEKVARALGAQLEPVIYRLLEGGINE